MTRTIRVDEKYTLLHYVQSPSVALYWSDPNNHILYSLAVWLVRTIIPHPLLALRLPAFMAALAGIYLIFRLAYKWWGYNTAIIAAAFLAMNPFYANYAVEGRAYTLTIALMLFFFLVENRWGLFLISFALVLAIPSNVLILAAKPRRPVVAGGILAGLIYVPVLFDGRLVVSPGRL